MTDQSLPLFPLNTVLFPGAPLTLHIFEERYRLMIGQCLEEEQPFGVIFTRKSSSSEYTTDISVCGTVAQIQNSVRLEDGRFLIATVGQQRFQVQRVEQESPYMVATVQLLSEHSVIDLTVASEKLRSTYDRYWQAVTSATGSQSQGDELPDDTVAMVYSLAHRMQVTNERKQFWLEADVVVRIRDIVTMLQAEMSLLPRADDQSPPGDAPWPWSWN